MIVSHNFKFIDEGDFKVGLNDRAFQYGDGLFETIYFNESKIYFFNDHVKRLKRGMLALGFEGIEALKKAVLKQQIMRLAEKNGIHGAARIKIIVWRKQGGHYTPGNRHFNVLILFRKIEGSGNFSSIRLSFSERVRVQYSKYSAFKTCNALPYILAGIEAENRKVDDLILLDQKGNVAECNYSNIFWVKDNEIFTPSIKTGCVAGVSRKHIINILKKENYTVKEVKSNRKAVLKADYVFISNVMQIRHVYRIDKKRFSKFTVIENLINNL